MRRESFVRWSPVLAAVCLTIAAVIGFVNREWLWAGFEAVGAACFAASAVLTVRRNRAQ